MKLLEHAHILHVLKHHPIPQALWDEVAGQAPVLRGLSSVERAHLRELSTLFLHRKSFSAVQGLELDERMRLIIAAQACLPILELGLDYYDGWVEIVVYPAGFRVRHEHADAAGVVHQEERALSGESWSRGPLILSWEDVEHDLREGQPGRNVVIHEFAHKLDALSGSANGMPPLHPDMERERWTESLSHAYAVLREQLAHHHHPCLNPYAATDPAEFFAVCSEYFFTAPEVLKRHCAEVYEQLAAFYRQQPLERLAAARRNEERQNQS
ncbi:MAG TPA: zinc-dependent peptidase [Gammaproteobacteria bacterium]|nr:zinc-dependent peptidase [Gammaproteobacteria bacterium]